MNEAQSQDLDVFVALFKLDAQGRHVPFPYYAQFEDGPVAVGWQRASHREPDRERSAPYLPVLAHLRALPVPVIGRVEDGALILDLRCLENVDSFVANLARLDMTPPLESAP